MKISQDIFISIKVKKLNYSGLQSTSLFIRDVTKKVVSVKERVLLQEAETSKLHAEAFTGTINHEMRLPVAMLILSVSQVSKLVKKSPSLPAAFATEIG